jgi:flagellar hook-associated protein 2
LRSRRCVSVASDTTLAGARDAINQVSDNSGIKASIIKVNSGSQLMLTSDKVGAANTLSVVATDTDVLDGNDLSDVISGVTIALKKADPLITGSLSIALDKDASMSNLRIDENILDEIAGLMVEIQMGWDGIPDEFKN